MRWFSMTSITISILLLVFAINQVISRETFSQLSGVWFCFTCLLNILMYSLALGSSSFDETKLTIYRSRLYLYWYSNIIISLVSVAGCYLIIHNMCYNTFPEVICSQHIENLLANAIIHMIISIVPPLIMIKYLINEALANLPDGLYYI
jgi:hypothetical protein